MATEQLRLSMDTPPPAPRMPAVRASIYDGASQARRTRNWHAPTTSANSNLYSLATLRDRSRAAARNDGYADNILRVLVSNIIGTGIKPLSQTSDPELRRVIQTLFLRWTNESDADGLLDWYGQQAQATRGWLEGGEVFIRRRDRRLEDGLSVPLQVQVIEPELCPYTLHRALANGNRIRAGIEFNGLGQRVAYWFHPSRPGDFLDYDPGQMRRVLASSVIHLFDPERAGQLRGTPKLSRVLVALHELDKMDDAILLRQQIANLFAGFLKRPAQAAGAEDINPITNEAVSGSSDDIPAATLEPGTMQELLPGEEIEFSNPPEPRGYPDFMRQQLMRVCAGTGVPYELLTGDMRGLSDRVLRVVLNEFRRQIQMAQHHVFAHQVCRVVWGWWFERAWLSGALPLGMDYVMNPAPLMDVKWMPQGWPYLHPVQDISAKKAAIRAGLTSRSAEVSEQGEDAELIDAEQRADNDRADALGLKYDSDARQKATASEGARA